MDLIESFHTADALQISIKNVMLHPISVKNVTSVAQSLGSVAFESRLKSASLCTKKLPFWTLYSIKKAITHLPIWSGNFNRSTELEKGLSSSDEKGLSSSKKRRPVLLCRPILRIYMHLSEPG
jgi:hypothetical protein